jgi:16S rRNA A1518/A1519 N6-dimethyltransferase RsmA/KsgA/DIM1 with predicted DNA glycosylase/AP lyase activity
MKRLAHYSQYFLRSPQLVKELIGHTSITRNDIVYDIGAGSGTISSVLAEKCQSVAAIELEPRMVDRLRTNMQKYPNVTVNHDDFLEMKLPKTPYKIFANIPFHLSSPIVHKIAEDDFPPEATYLIVQKQFANKLLPDFTGFTGQLGMAIGPEFAVRIRKKLQRTDYSPRPNVDTVLLEIIRRPEPLIPRDKMPDYRRFIVGCFSDPKIFSKAPRRAIGLAPDIRPSQMKLTQWVKLFLIHETFMKPHKSIIKK